MGQCKHHPESSTEGVCSSCLQKKLKLVRWGEPGYGSGASLVMPSKLGTTLTTPTKPKAVLDPVHPKEAIAIIGSIASIKNRNQRGFHLPGRDITAAGLDFVLDSRYTDGSTPTHPLQIPTAKVLTMQSKPSNVKNRKRWLNTNTNNMNNTNKKAPGVDQTLALQDSKPLVDRLAKETALRVIREVTDEIWVEEGGEEKDGATGKMMNGSSFFSPSLLLSKWGIKGIGGSPLNTSSNKVFPSKQTAAATDTRLVQSLRSPARDQSRVHILATSGADLQQPASGDRIKGPGGGASSKGANQETVIVGMPDRILKPEDMNQRLRTSYNTVLQWLEDLPVPDTLVLQKIGGSEQDLSMKEKRNLGRLKQNLSTAVGRLHEIAEEHEILDEESSVDSEAAVGVSSAGNHLNDVSSFGKFLIRAAQRQPKQGLSRVQARATATVTAR